MKDEGETKEQMMNELVGGRSGEAEALLPALIIV